MFRRSVSKLVSPNRLYLPSRSVIAVSGPKVSEFLQSLFTNDVRYLTSEAEDPVAAQYGCFLNAKGRVLFDGFISRMPESLMEKKPPSDGFESFLVEVDERVEESVLDHFDQYNLDDHEVVPMSESIVVSSTLAQPHIAKGEEEAAKESAEAGSSSHKEVPVSIPPQAATALGPQGEIKVVDYLTFTDPRTPLGALGMQRIYSSRDEFLVADATNEHDFWRYNRFVYQYGVGEGPDVFVEEKSLPFEGNLDFIGGVKFDKGCYLGQELTHRTHVMLVTRKRVVPISIELTPDEQEKLEFNFSQQTTDQLWGIDAIGTNLLRAHPVSGEMVPIGKVVGASGPHGIALVRLQNLNPKTLAAEVVLENSKRTAIVTLPSWWEEKEKEKVRTWCTELSEGKK